LNDEQASHVAHNRAYWTKVNAQYTDAAARECWAEPEIRWGVFGNRERDLGVLGDVRGLDVVELGCGTAYFSAWLAQRGARVVGVDVTPAQLSTAARLQRETGIRFPLIEASAENVPLPDATFDLALSEYGASLWCNPALWVPEAARLLRPAGRLVFLTSSTLNILCAPDEGPADERLHRPQRDMHRIVWPHGGIEFHLGHGEWIRLLRANGFDIDSMVELYAPEEAQAHSFYTVAGTGWGRKWPVEDLWTARKTR
jgi:SAM-dependent methyltransferase